mmetsp:Transcript_46424/g.137151  ORF Transcript_46424/g.137151 Transcript_46424/m.137151 type:complete len:109 (-) Transcript_46424:462-788(-)
MVSRLYSMYAASMLDAAAAGGGGPSGTASAVRSGDEGGLKPSTDEEEGSDGASAGQALRRMDVDSAPLLRREMRDGDASLATEMAMEERAEGEGAGRESTRLELRRPC